MGWLTRILGGKDKSAEGEGAAAQVQPAQAPAQRKGGGGSLPITLDILRELFPIRNLSEEEVSTFAMDRSAEAFPAGTVLFTRDAEAESIFYLLDGTVLMELGESNNYAVQSGTAKARFPLCSGKRYSATATAQTDVQVLRVSPKLMWRHAHRDPALLQALDPQDPSIPDKVRGTRLFQAFCQFYRDEELTIPSLPDVAIKLRKAMEFQADVAEVVAIVQLDPAIAAKLVHVANSPLYLSANPIHNLRDAVLRLGLAATRNLVISYSLRQIFQCKEPFLNELLYEEWKKSIYLSCLCYVLASDNRGMDAEEALLAGLIADIGVVPFLYFVENFPREYWSPIDVAEALPWIRGPVGTFVLNRWDFAPQLMEIPQRAEDWFHDSGQGLHLSDIVVLSRLHSYIGSPRMVELPSINSIPACGKLQNGELSPAHSLKVLHDAKDKISQAMKFFES